MAAKKRRVRSMESPRSVHGKTKKASGTATFKGKGIKKRGIKYISA